MRFVMPLSTEVGNVWLSQKASQVVVGMKLRPYSPADTSECGYPTYQDWRFSKLLCTHRVFSSDLTPHRIEKRQSRVMLAKLTLWKELSPPRKPCITLSFDKPSQHFIFIQKTNIHVP
jgi:hypothetical protein